MNPLEQLDFLAAFGQEFSGTIRPDDDSVEIVPQDGYEVFRRVFKVQPTPENLKNLTSSQLEQLRVGCEAYFECEGITIEQIRKFAARVLGRFPPNG